MAIYLLKKNYKQKVNINVERKDRLVLEHSRYQRIE